LLRLILAIMVALSAPAAMAMPACHAEMPAMTMHHDSAPAKATLGEPLCLGCVAPATVHPPVLTEQIAPDVRPSFARALGGVDQPGAAPGTPPPRQG
jgi:hypothetical protein